MKAFHYNGNVYEQTKGPHGKDNAWVEGERTGLGGARLKVSALISEITPVSDKFHWGYRAEPLLPDAESFSDLFCDEQGSVAWEVDGDIAQIGDYIQIGDPFRSLYRRPTPDLVEAVKENMLCINYDSINFKIILHGDTADVFASHNTIIGSRYVARIKSNTITKGK